MPDLHCEKPLVAAVPELLLLWKHPPPQVESQQQFMQLYACILAHWRELVDVELQLIERSATQHIAAEDDQYSEPFQQHLKQWRGSVCSDINSIGTMLPYPMPLQAFRILQSATTEERCFWNNAFNLLRGQSEEPIEVFLESSELTANFQTAFGSEGHSIEVLSLWARELSLCKPFFRPFAQELLAKIAAYKKNEDRADANENGVFDTYSDFCNWCALNYRGPELDGAN